MTHRRQVISIAFLSFVFACIAAARTPVANAQAVAAVATDSGAAGPELPRVIVSAREARVIFAREADAWEGRRDIPLGELLAEYGWQVHVDGIERPYAILLGMPHSDSSTAFPTLEHFLSAVLTSSCRSEGMMASCRQDSTIATIRDGRVMIVIRDSVRIAEMFGLRPTDARVFRPMLPDAPLQLEPATARIEYVAPAIPVPADDLLQRSEREWASYRASLNAIHRELSRVDVEDTRGPLWLAVGDTAALATLEVRCRIDVCSNLHGSIADSGWTVDDSSIAVLQSFPDERSRRMPLFRRAAVRLIGEREGRTVVRVTGLSSPGDDMPVRSPVPRSLERELIVTRPVARIELRISRDTVRAGEPVDIEAQAHDARGVPVTGVPIRRWVGGPRLTRSFEPDERAVLVPDQPGTWTIGAVLGSHRVTRVLTVLPAGGS